MDCGRFHRMERRNKYNRAGFVQREYIRCSVPCHQDQRYQEQPGPANRRRRRRHSIAAPCIITTCSSATTIASPVVWMRSFLPIRTARKAQRQRS